MGVQGTPSDYGRGPAGQDQPPHVCSGCPAPHLTRTGDQAAGRQGVLCEGGGGACTPSGSNRTPAGRVCQQVGMQATPFNSRGGWVSGAHCTLCTYQWAGHWGSRRSGLTTVLPGGVAIVGGVAPHRKWEVWLCVGMSWAAGARHDLCQGGADEAVCGWAGSSIFQLVLVGCCWPH